MRPRPVLGLSGGGAGHTAHPLSSAWTSGLRCATLTSAHTLPSVCVADLGERASAPVHTQTRTDESTEGETRRSSDATRRN